MGLPEKKGNVGKNTESKAATATSRRPPTKATAGRRAHDDGPCSIPSASRKAKEPQCASEAPKISATKNVHPTSKSTESAKSSDSKKVPNDNHHAARSRAGGDSKQLPNEPSHPAHGTSKPSSQVPMSHEDIKEIERQTRGQRTNQDWHHWRQNRITASLAHKISHSKFANEKTSEVPQSYLKSVLGTAPRVQTPAMTWGIRNEKRAVDIYEKQASQSKGHDVTVEDCGLFIHPTKNWLAASPDGIVKDKNTGESLRTLEVKCPYKHKEHTVREACQDRDFCLTLAGDSYALKPSHPYYTQVQCQMASTGLKNADFVVHTNKETAIVPVHFDAEFWEKTEPKLEKFYKEAVVPKITKHSVAKEAAAIAIHAPEE